MTEGDVAVGYLLGLSAWSWITPLPWWGDALILGAVLWFVDWVYR